MFLIFGGQCYYAGGGANDLIDCKADKAEAVELAQSLIGKRAIYEVVGDDPEYDLGCEIEWSHVLDVRNNKVVKSFGGSPYGFDTHAVQIRDTV